MFNIFYFLQKIFLTWLKQKLQIFLSFKFTSTLNIGHFMYQETKLGPLDEIWRFPILIIYILYFEKN